MSLPTETNQHRPYLYGKVTVQVSSNITLSLTQYRNFTSLFLFLTWHAQTVSNIKNCEERLHVLHHIEPVYCYEHGKSLPAMLVLWLGKRVSARVAYENTQENGAIDHKPSDEMCEISKVLNFLDISIRPRSRDDSM
ncbi:hypothetical protein AVEN_100205-1 [Araneus ventricosus]|uniref:Uncharacterized protein n=1 Tax=Araneus ventricosus TaxID=182803 RepID=A0A4Y2LQA5_ARAVE|nr:hypothetical protein AVEN_100205-1 [Araneus ventricosus]